MGIYVESDAHAPWVWVAAFGLSLVCLAAAGFELFFSREPRSKWIRAGVRFGLLLLALLGMADLNGWIIAALPESELLLRVIVMGVGMLGLIVIVCVTRQASRQVVCGLALMSCLAISWTSWRVVALANPGEEGDLAVVALSPGDRVEPLPALYAETDGGRQIPLFQSRPLGGNSNANSQARTVISPELQALVIAVEPPNEKTNCHGWVFAGGKAVIQGRVVDAILSDNGYQRVTRPSVGDVILYRDAQGITSHTGLVKATGSEGFVLIESKWGFDGRYLHQPQDQCYSKTFEYYRSPRLGHLLRFDESALMAAQPAMRQPIVVSSSLAGS